MYVLAVVFAIHDGYNLHEMTPQRIADPHKVIRDPIHGLIKRYPDEIRLMNTVVFQRLRRIRQLAMAHLVYPGALHSRFEHSVGAMHVAGRICGTLQGFHSISERETRIVRIAALLHDVGHGPFSHVSEYLLERHGVADAPGGVGTNVHERLTSQIVKGNGEISAILPQYEREEVLALLSEPQQRNFKRDIVSSSLDADKMDYLLRDGYFAGVKYGTFDLDKIIEAFRVHEAGDESYLALNHEGVYAFEQLIMAKYHMGQQVYFHRIRAITDAMIVRTVDMAIRENDVAIKSTFQYDGSEDFVDRWLMTDDDGLLRSLMESEIPVVSELSRRLYRRSLLKQICRLSLRPEDVPDAVVRDRLAKVQPGTAESQRVERAIGAGIDVDPDLVIFDTRSAGNPTFRSPSYRLDPDEILIMDEDNNPRKASEFPDVCLANTAGELTQTIQVYAPRDSWNDAETDTAQERDECQRAVREIILKTPMVGGPT